MEESMSHIFSDNKVVMSVRTSAGTIVQFEHDEGIEVGDIFDSGAGLYKVAAATFSGNNDGRTFFRIEPMSEEEEEEETEKKA